LPYQLAALLAAASWATSSLIAAEPVRRLGGPRFCRIRMLYASGMLLALATVTGGWSSLSRDDVGMLAVSGLIGIVKMGRIVLSSLSLAFKGFAGGGGEADAAERTDLDIGPRNILLIEVGTVLGMFLLFWCNSRTTYN